MDRDENTIDSRAASSAANHTLPAGQSPHVDMTVEEILTRWPETASVFLKYKTFCIGCSMSGFDTLQDAAQIYHLPLDNFLKDLCQVVEENVES